MSSADRSDWVTARLLSTAARVVEHAWTNSLRDHGISHAGVIVLSTLAGGAASQRELADAGHVTEQTMGRTLTHLERTGHVRRSTDADDRRRRLVKLTPAGAHTLAEIAGRGERFTHDVLGPTGYDRDRFRATLEALIDAFDGPGAAPTERDRVAETP